MRLRPSVRDATWMAVGASVLLLFVVLVLLFGQEPRPDAQLALRAQRLELVSRMQIGLAAASEAEKSAVLAVTDADSQAFADRARASTEEVERSRRELAESFDRGGAQQEKDLLAAFSRCLTEFQRIDGELLQLAVENSNLKAYALTFGEGASALAEMNDALSRVATANAAAGNAQEVTSLALGAQIAALRIQILLPPHIAEASDARMDELEAQIQHEDEQIGRDLEGLRALPKLRGDADLAAAVGRYAQLREIRGRILALSRRNTNVRSLSLSLNEERKVMLDCHDALGSLQEAIQKEPVAGAGGRFGLR